MYALTTVEADLVCRLVDHLRNSRRTLGHDRACFHLDIEHEDWMRLLRMREHLLMRLRP
jgi:hypothetical protein